MTELEKLKERMFELGLMNFHITPGPKWKDLETEERAAVINKVYDDIEAGNCEFIEDFGDGDMNQIDVKDEKMIGLFDQLTPEQQKAALEYDGPENHGDDKFKIKKENL